MAKKFFSKALAVGLALAMCLSLLPVSAFAADSQPMCTKNHGFYYPEGSWIPKEVGDLPLKFVPAKAATCTEDGSMAHWTCNGPSGHDHNYADGNGKPGEWLSSTKTGEKALGHKMDGGPGYDENQHWGKSCSRSGCDKHEDVSNHQYDANGKCSCGYQCPHETKYTVNWNDVPGNHCVGSTFDRTGTCTHCGATLSETAVAGTRPHNFQGGNCQDKAVCSYGNCDVEGDLGTTHKGAADGKWVEVEGKHIQYYTCCPAVVAVSHDASFTNYVSNNDATCTADGTETAECDHCTLPDTKTETNSKKPHSYSTVWSTDETNHWHECECGAKADEGAHSYKYVKDGDKWVGTCKTCDKTVESATLPSGAEHEHFWGEWTITVEPTVDAEGTAVRYCECGAEDTETLPALNDGDVWAWDEEDSTAATCVATGLDVYTSEYGVVRVILPIDPDNHDNGAWVVTRAAAPGVAGLETLSCTRCGAALDTRTTAALPDETVIDDVAVPLAAGPVTRAEFLDYLWRYEGEPASDGVCTFADVAADHEFILALAWAEETGIAETNVDGLFEPDELVTVAAIQEFLGNYAEVFELDVDVFALATLTGEDDEAVLNCDEILEEFFELVEALEAAA